jgi:transcriptional regulator with XRE-family HTH domain
MAKTFHSRKYKSVCSYLEEVRRQRGLSQAQIAEKLSKPQSFVSKYESGERRLDVVEFFEICCALELDWSSAFAELEAILKTD